MAQFKPFQDETTSLTLDQLTIENRMDRIAVYGSLQITRDKSGLQWARQLKEWLDATVAALEQEVLPEQVEIRPKERIENPFK
ncbi:hypothetical protein EDC30_11275 [Paucimonas lemoignei]|uniref:Uncharacterized protein n=1 Tax=Paucimonas lemoignei TaxID=29443 RepID=A0A4R3HQX0_PAULE|nr:hypothetical protein [Paucimonas lemoignei]TCS34743.1 hypothetical protein EDC30_11275 [Paucimonas lemoignei]